MPTDVHNTNMASIMLKFPYLANMSAAEELYAVLDQSKWHSTKIHAGFAIMIMQASTPLDFIDSVVKSPGFESMPR